MYISPSLRPLASHLAARLPGTTHPWGRSLAWVLRTRIVVACWLPRSMAGFTNPLLPLILVDYRLARRLGSGTVDLDVAGKITGTVACTVAQLLLHEAAHQLWAVWPEWRRWFGLKRIYGPRINAADAVAEAVCRELCAVTRYPGEELRYRSPLAFIGRWFRR